jgi:hypothetical protein
MQLMISRNTIVHIDTEYSSLPDSRLAHNSEPVFQLFGSTKLNIDTHGLQEKFKEYFDYSVARNPNDLRTHIQRINLHVRNEEADRAEGALLDLFIVLGSKGTALREHMLKTVTPLLNQESKEFFLVNFSCGISATDVMPDSAHSVLTKAVSGITELVQQVESLQSEELDPLQEARDCLEYGQIIEAQCILEAAILEHPDRVEIHHELLDIYRYTVDEMSFNTMRNQLEAKHNPFAQLWESMASLFKDAASQ